MNEKEIQEAATQLESLRIHLENLKQQDTLLRTMNDEYMQARDTLLNLKEQKKDGQMLVPVGANCFVFAKIDDANKIIYSLGSNIATEGTAEDAIERLDRRIAEFSDAGTKLSQRMTEIDTEAQTLTAVLQKEYEKHM